MLQAPARLAGSCQRDADLSATPTDDGHLRRFSDFATLNEALDYAALGERGINFHDARGSLTRVYRYSELRHDAVAASPSAAARGIGKGGPDRADRGDGSRVRRLVLRRDLCRRLACATAAADLVRRRGAYIDQSKVQLESSDPTMLLYPGELPSMAAKLPARRAVCRDGLGDLR